MLSEFICRNLSTEFEVYVNNIFFFFVLYKYLDAKTKEKNQIDGCLRQAPTSGSTQAKSTHSKIEYKYTHVYTYT